MTAAAGEAAAGPEARLAGGTAATVVLLLLLLTIFAWDRGVLAVSLPEIRGSLGLSPHQVGLVATVFTAGIALVAVPAGLLVRRIGFRAALIGGAILFSAATCYPPLARGFGGLLVSRIMVGLGEGVFHVALLIYLASISGRHRAAMIGLAATIYGLGASTGPAVINAFNAAVGNWHLSFYGLGAIGLLLCVPLIPMMAPAAHADAATAESAPPPVPWGRLAHYWPLLLLVGVQGLVLYSITGLLPTWTRTNFGFSPAAGALALSAAGAGMMLGGAPMGLLADRMRRVPYLVGAGCVGGISAMALMGVDLGPTTAIAIAFLFGVAAQTLYVTAIATAQESAGDAAPPLVGLIVTIFYGAASISGLVLVQASERFGYQAGAIGTYALLYGIGIATFALFQRRAIVRDGARLAHGNG